MVAIIVNRLNKVKNDICILLTSTGATGVLHIFQKQRNIFLSRLIYVGFVSTTKCDVLRKLNLIRGEPLM